MGRCSLRCLYPYLLSLLRLYTYSILSRTRGLSRPSLVSELHLPISFSENLQAGADFRLQAGSKRIPNFYPLSLFSLSHRGWGGGLYLAFPCGHLTPNDSWVSHPLQALQFCACHSLQPIAAVGALQLTALICSCSSE